MCVALEVPNASRRVRLSSSLEGERGQKDAETKHYKQSKRCDHRSEECDRFRHRCLSLPQLHAGALTDPRKATGRDISRGRCGLLRSNVRKLRSLTSPFQVW